MASLQKRQETTQGLPSMESIEPASLLEANLRAGVTSENHLRSLGFVMDNGRPRFKIDEPVRNSHLSSLKSGPNQNSMDSEEESFIVLGKDSLCSIRASSLASYAEIQRKSLSTDYSSIISSLTAEETEKKLRELLQENVKLKETLSQNNMAMKRQFNTLAAWQEEITKVHQSHKQKFRETKELISQLRKENAELKTKASNQLTAASDPDLKMRELEEQLQKTLIAQEAVQSAREIELEESNSRMKKELEESKTACKLLTTDIQRYTILSTRLSQQLKQADLTIEGLKLDLEKLELNLKEKEQLASLADYSLLAVSSKQAKESDVWREKSSRQEKEIMHLKELIVSLEKQLKLTSQNSLPSIELQSGNNGNRIPSEDSLQLIKNVKQYNDILQKLSECYAKQGSGYVKVQECLTESIDTIQDLEKSDGDSATSQQEKLEKLANCRGRLNDERLEMINERQELIKAQNQVQKVFSDYNSVLYELEIMQEENAKLSYLQDRNSEAAAQKETQETSSELKENLSKEKKLLEESEASLLQERTSLLEEKKAREAAEIQCENLKTDLSRQKLLQEAEKKSFLAEKRQLTETVKGLQTKNQNLEESLKSNAEEIDRLKDEVKSLKEALDKLPHLEAQIQVYEADFREEREARQQLAHEKNTLVDEIRKLQQFHRDLGLTQQGQPMQQQQQQQQQHEARRQPSASAPSRSDVDQNDESITVITAFSCPKCSLTFTAIRPLQEHVEECLQLE